MANVREFRDEYLEIMEEMADAQAEIANIDRSFKDLSGGKTVNVSPDGNAPAGTKVGDTVITSGGDHAFLVVPEGTPNAKKNPNSGLSSIQLYDEGGRLKSVKTAIKLSGADEHVLNPEQTKAFDIWLTKVPDLFNNLKLSSNKMPILSGFNPSNSNGSGLQLSIANMIVHTEDGNDFIAQMKNLVAVNNRR